MKRFYIETFGCQMNAHDSENVIGTLMARGYEQVGRQSPRTSFSTTPVVFAIRLSRKSSTGLNQFKREAGKGEDLRGARVRGPAGR